MRNLRVLLVLTLAGCATERATETQPRGPTPTTRTGDTSDPAPAAADAEVEELYVSASSLASEEDSPSRSAPAAVPPPEPRSAPVASSPEPRSAPAAASPSEKVTSAGDDGSAPSPAPLTLGRGSLGVTGSGAGYEAPRKTTRPPPPVRRPPSSPGVKAGAADDNLQFGAFLAFLGENRRIGRSRDISQRFVVTVVDRDGRPVPGASVRLLARRRVLQRRKTYADGRALLFPSELPGKPAVQDLSVEVRYGPFVRTVPLASSRGHRLEVSLDSRREPVERVPLDVAFVLDTTGSMGDELERLKRTIETIHFQITHLSPRPDVRFGLVMYRDQGDDYVAKRVPFTADLAAFQATLAAVQAGGGGDYPEAVEVGLALAMRKLEWRKEGVRIGFLIGDAPPHLERNPTYSYQDAATEAAERGIKFATIGASGLSKVGEVVWRQLAQYTMGPFVFLTYGETGDSEGSASTVSHHVGSNWVAENLDAIVVRMVKVELAHYSPRGAPDREDYFVASAAVDVAPETVLEDLFRQSLKQLVDYAVERIAPRTPTVVLPLTAHERVSDGVERLERRLLVGLARRPQFNLVVHEERDAVLQKLAEQLSARYDDAQATEIGKLVPAKLAVLGSLAPGKEGRVEMLLRLVRLTTGEVLSLSLLRIDEALL